MENLDNGLTVPKWVLINRPKIPQMPQDLSAQIVYLKVWDFDGKRLHWESIVRAYKQSTQIFSSSVVLSSWGLLLKNKWQEFFLPKNCCFHDNGGVTQH